MSSRQSVPFQCAGGLPADLRLAARRLLAAPLFTSFAVLSLAVGVALTTAVYSVVDSILLKDLGIRDQNQVLSVVTPGDGRLGNRVVSEPDFQDLRRRQTSFSRISASTSFAPAVATPTVTELVPGEAVEGTYFSTLGIIASVGRVIQPADETARARVAVLSDALWRARFASDSKIIGQTIRISGDAFEVIGVAAASFDGLRDGPRRTRLWIPLAAHTPSVTASKTPPRERRELTVVGRLTPSITAATAAAEVSTIAAGLDAAFPRDSITKQPGPSERSWRLKPVASNDLDNLPHRFGFTVIALVALVLVVACTNVGNLVLARGTMRQHEVAVRSALGASSWRLVREQLAESVLIATGGAVASYIVFQILCVLMAADFQVALPFGGRWTLSVQPSLNAPALATGAVALLIALVVFGLEPALQLTRSRDIRGGLASGGGGVGAPRAGRHRALLRWQVAISAGFFIIATMFVKYTIAEARHDSGIDLDRIGAAVLNSPTHDWDETRLRRTVERVLEETRRDPAIATASVSTGLPFGVPAMRVTLTLPDKPIQQNSDFLAAAGIAATPSIFRTLGVPVIRGRGFDDRDHSGAPLVVVLSEFTARSIFGTSDVVGRRLVIQGPSSRVSDARSLATVVGIAGDTDVKQLFRGPGALVYLPLMQRFDTFLTVAARTTGDPALAVRAVREAIRRTDSDLAVDVSGTGREVLAGAFVLLRAAGVAAVSLGGLTLLLAMVGLFGIQSHMVAHRTCEIGVRMSFGATAARIRMMVLRDGYRPVLEGLALGLFIGLTGRAIVRAYLGLEVSVVDPWMLLVVPIPLILAALCACYLPAQRAASVDPIVALRHV